jgi:hypothetical protein
MNSTKTGDEINVDVHEHERQSILIPQIEKFTNSHDSMICITPTSEQG